MSASAAADEPALWRVLSTVEAHTADRYAQAAPALAAPERPPLVAQMRRLAGGVALEDTGLDGPVRSLLQVAEGQGTAHDAALLQGLLLEQLGATLYTTLAEGGRLTAAGQALASDAAAASRAAAQRAVAQLRAEHPDPQERFYAFTAASRPLLAQLDSLGEALDGRFAAPLELRFADVLGDFMAELLPCCVSELGFSRRRVMVHFTQALMSA